MNAVVGYLLTLVVFFFINNILVWGLNIQFGFAGILNFAYIIFVAIGAYIAGTFALPHQTTYAGQTYFFGYSLPFPIPLLAGGVVAALFGVFVSFIALKRLRSDYMAIVTVSVATITYDIIGNYFPLFNGWDGLGSVPAPLQSTLIKNGVVDYNGYQFVFLAVVTVIMVILGVVAQRLYYSPFGRTLRAIREDIDASESFGKNAFNYRVIAMAIGCFYAGIGGGLLIEYISAFSPAGWTIGETFILYAALIIGGRANNWGAVLGTFLVPILFQEATRFLPMFPHSETLIPAMRNIIVGALFILMLWFRPQGAIPERKARYQEPALSTAENVKEEADVALG